MNHFEPLSLSLSGSYIITELPGHIWDFLEFILNPET